MSNLLNIKDQNGNWIPIPVITNGIQSITQNQDYTLTITLNDGTTYTTTSIKGEDGEDYILTGQDKQEIADLINAPVDDVQINGTSIVSDGVAEIPIASTSTLGAVTCAQDYGIIVLSNGRLQTTSPSDAQLKSGSSNYRVITPTNQHKSVFYGLAKASGDTTQSESDNAVGIYTDEAKTAIKSMLGVEDPVIDDVQINGTSIVADGTANIPFIGYNRHGIAKLAANTNVGGLSTDATGVIYIDHATSALIKTGTNRFRPVTPDLQHESAFYGLAKAAGSDEKDSTLPVGQYTDSAKTAIKQMLDVKDDYDSLVVEVSGTDPVITGKPSYRYNCGELYTLSITPPETGTMDIIFTSGATPTVLTLPNTVKMPDWWAGIETNTTYEMCITDGAYCGVMSWEA